MVEPRSVLLQGNWNDRSSFSIVSRRIAQGLVENGYAVTVFPNEPGAAGPDCPAPPDIYLFHGFGYDARNAPGRLNVFFFTYEYLDLEPKYAGIVQRLNAYFDLVITPSEYVKQICLRNGVTIPVEVVSHGADAAEFGPAVTPEPLPTKKRFRFLNLGGMFDRKGTDVLLRAYLDEFTAADDVTLILKARGYELAAEWAKRTLSSARIDRPGAPEVIVTYQDVPSVAGYYTAADVGVFPHRGEGFGLPILECLASGRPVIVTGGTGEMDYCTPKNARFIESTPKMSRGRRMLEPDVASLRAHLREAFEQGPLGTAAQRAIARSVSAFTWERTHRQLAACLRRAWRAKTTAAPSTSATTVTYCYFAKGRMSFKRAVLEIDALLHKRYRRCISVPEPCALPGGRTDLVVGQSEFCLEGFLRAAETNPQVRTVLHQEGTALERRIAITNQERLRCGVPPILKPPLELWRNKMECDLADYLVVASSPAARYFLEAGYSSDRVKVIPWGFDLRAPVKRRRSGKLRFLFAGTEPFRKGIRVLLEAWDALRPAGAELWCYTSEEVLQSQKLLRYVVANPSVIIKPLIPHRTFQEVLREVDCQVLPSFEDSFSFVIGDGMGCAIPAIVSDETGIADLIVDGENGLITKTGSARKLAAALDYCCSHPRRLREMGQAAHETARLYPWERFRGDFTALTESCLKNPKTVRA